MRNCLRALVILAVGVGGTWAAPNAVAPPPPGLRLLEADSSGLVLEWVAPPVQVRPLADNALEVTAAGCPLTQQPGEPRLPFASILIALPPGVVPRLQVPLIEQTSQPLPAPIAVAPRPEGTVQDGAGQPIGGAFVAVEPTGRTSIPEPVLLEEIGVLRGVRLARLTFYPARPEGDRLLIVHRLRAEIRWSVGRAGSPSYDPLIHQVQQAVLNPQDVILAPAASPQSRAISPAGGGTPIAFLEVRSPGLYRVSFTDLEPLGFGAVNPNFLRLFRGDDEVIFEWQGDMDDVFESGEAILFYAEPRFSRCTDRDVYRLVPAAPGPNWMTTRSADPANLPAAAPWAEQTFEENHEYTPDRFAPGIPPGRDGDRWVWDYLSHPGHPTQMHSFSVPAGGAGQLTLWLIGFTAGDHRWDISLNGTFIGSVTWTGRTAVTATLPIPPAVLREGANTLSVTLPITEGAWLDAFAVRYVRSTAPSGTSATFGELFPSPPPEAPAPLSHRLYLPMVLRNSDHTGWRAYTVALAVPGPYRAYDVTDPLSPVRLTDFQVEGRRVTIGERTEGGPRRYLIVAESAIRAPYRVRPREDIWGFHVTGGATGAHYLVITHPAFAEALSPLVDLRRSQGLSALVVNVLGIYDTYGDGRPDPEAIRRFIADAYTTWDPRPVYVLLVGDGSFDPRQYRSDSPPTFIPPYLADVDPWGGETAADNRYVCVDGDDNLPDLLVGRLPVGSPEEAAAVVEKIIAYEASPLPGGWNARVVLVADDADHAGDFTALSEVAAGYVTDPFAVTRRYCPGTAADQSDCSEAAASALHTAVLGDWNEGALIFQYAGHSSWQQWAVERFFHTDDLSALHNSRRLPVVTEMTCLTGAFHRPEPTLDEELVVRPDAGAVAAWGPTGLGLGAGHSGLSGGFFRAVFADGVQTVGEATLAGKLSLAGSELHPDLLDTFTLLGDPAQRFQRSILPWAAQVYLPLAVR